ncbi:MAG: universal stress protein, partial [Syntrophales bacterium]|nr:universal stress protein [Syntrophales bacterium]
VINSRLYPWTLLGFDSTNYITEIETKNVQDAEEKLKKQMDACVLARKVKIIPVIKIGHLPEIILSEQEDKAIDFMVIGSPGRFNIIQKLVSTITSKIVRRTSFPTLIVSGSI